MKKLTLSFVVVLISFSLRAAAIAWGSDGSSATLTPLPNGSVLTDCVAYLCSGTDTAGTLASIQAGTWVDPKVTETTKNPTSKGIIGKGVSALSNAFSAGSTYSFFLVIFSGDNEYVAISSVKEGTPFNNLGTDPATNVLWDANGLMASTNGWTLVGGENVPEPTVLALLALGVAGVALRRKKMA